MTELHFGLDTPMPETMLVKRAAALYLAGWIFHRTRPIRKVEIVVDGHPQPVIASHMPRYDVYRQWRDATSNSTYPYRSGFWALVELRASSEGRARLSLRAWIDDKPWDVAISAMELRGVEDTLYAQHVSGAMQRRIAICMATFNPDAGGIRRQVESLRNQTHRDWICLINDDCSSDGALAAVREAVGTDRRFTIARNETRRGFYANFEACLARVPPDAAFVALSDQDDRWYAEKLETLLGRLVGGSALLAHSDMRIVDARGRVLQPSFWRRRHSSETDLGSLLCANTVTGASMLFSRDLLDALPFPLLTRAFHDHWLACVALALGRVSFVDRPLYDYVQHQGNVLGHEVRPGSDSLVARTPQEWYFVNLVTAVAFSREILARFAGRVAAPDQHVLSHVSQLDSRPGRAWLRREARMHLSDKRFAHLLAAASWRAATSRISLPPNRLVSVSKSAIPSRAI